MAQSLDQRTQTASEALMPVWVEIKTYLENMLQRLNHEISHYPQPIARCDEQLTALLDQRTEVVALLEKMEKAHR
jgi:hypothetical protein